MYPRLTNDCLVSPQRRETLGSEFFERCLAKSRGPTPEERRRLLGYIPVFVYRFNHDRLVFVRSRADHVFFDRNLARIIVHSSRDREQHNEEHCDREDFATPFENSLPTHDARSSDQGVSHGHRISTPAYALKARTLVPLLPSKQKLVRLLQRKSCSGPGLREPTPIQMQRIGQGGVRLTLSVLPKG